MALNDKNIVITPNIGQTAEPIIVFAGASAALGPQVINLVVYPTNNGTLSFEGSAGQLFSITNDLTGSIFSVNDVSGIPSIEVFADGIVRLAQYSGNTIVGNAADLGQKLQIAGSVAVGTHLANYAVLSGSATGQAVTLTTDGADSFIDLNLTTKGAGSITIESGAGAGVVNLKPGGGTVRVWDDDSSHYFQIVTGNIAANYSLTLPAGNVVLVTGTMVPTSRTLAIASGTGITGGQAALDLSANRSWTFSLTGQALALHNLASDGIIVRTGAGTVAARTITGTGNQVTVTNGDGVAGNPVLSLPQNIHASATPVFAAITINGNAGIRAAAAGSAATHIPVFTADPSATTRTLTTRTPTQLRDDLNVLGDTFETIAKALKAYNATYNYTGENLTSVVYTVPSVGTITKTLNYTSDKLTSVVLSGSTPSGISLTKTLTYTGDNLTGVAYT